MLQDSQVVLTLIAVLPVAAIVLVLVFDAVVRRAARRHVESRFRDHYRRRIRRRRRALTGSPASLASAKPLERRRVA